MLYFTKNEKITKNFSFCIFFAGINSVKMDDFGSHGVDLYIYDMTQGMAAMMSPMFLGGRFIS